MLLGLDEAWVVEQVDLALAEKQVEIRLRHRGGPRRCPEASTTLPTTAPESSSTEKSSI
jgi:hypothetical protein